MADQDVATKTKVVIIVSPRVDQPSAVEVPASVRDTAPVEVPASARDTAPVEVPASARDTAPVEVPAPSEKKKSKRSHTDTAKVPGYIGARDTAPVAPPRLRSAEDDALVAAVIQIDLRLVPSPLTDFLGRSLLFRAARVAADLGAPRLILVGNLPEAERTAVFEEAYAGFRGGPVEVTDRDPGPRTFGRGRILLLDGSALHDPSALERLARVQGERIALLLGQAGDGMRVSTEAGRVRDLGAELSPYDGVLVGAASVPVEDFELLSQVGEKSALYTLSDQQRLIGTVANDTFAQQLRSRERLVQAQVECFAPLASSGGEGLFEDLVGRPFARLLTSRLLHTRVSSSAVSVVAGALALLAAGLLALGHVGAALAAAALAIASAILDRTDGELARLRLDDEQRGLDFGLDHMAHAIIFLGLAYGVQHPASGAGGWGAALARLPVQLREALMAYNVSALTMGFFAAAGVLLLLGVLTWRGAPRRGSRGLRRLGDLIATSFGARDYFYVLLGVCFLNALPGMAELGVLGLFLLVSTALVHLAWVLLLIVSLPAPRA